jgi:hypothetical protein
MHDTVGSVCCALEIKWHEYGLCRRLVPKVTKGEYGFKYDKILITLEVYQVADIAKDNYSPASQRSLWRKMISPEKLFEWWLREIISFVQNLLYH